MMESLWVKLIVGLIFVGYTGYTTFKSIRLYVTFKKKFENPFKKNYFQLNVLPGGKMEHSLTSKDILSLH